MQEEDKAKSKKIDESWKEAVGKEKSQEVKGQEKQNTGYIPETNLAVFLSTLSVQGLISLGDVPNPVTNQTKEDLPQAKYIIDTIDMLKEKMQGNLANDEAELFEEILYNLKLRYIQKTKKA